MITKEDESLEETIKDCFLGVLKQALLSKKFSVDYESDYDYNSFYLKLSRKSEIKILFTLSANDQIFTIEIFENGELSKHFSDMDECFKNKPFLRIYNNLNSQIIVVEMFFGELLENKTIFIKNEELINKNIFINLIVQKINGIMKRLRKKLEKENAKIEKQKDENL